MKHIFTKLTLICTIVLFSACRSNAPDVTWYEGEETHRFVGRNTSGLRSGWEIWFSQFPCPVQVLSFESNAAIQHVQANTYRIVPEEDEAVTDSIVVTYRSVPLKRHSWAPEGFTLVNNGRKTVLTSRYVFLPLSEADPSWNQANSLDNVHEVGYDAMIPALKRVSYMDGTTHLDGAEVVSEIVSRVGHPSGWYRITICGKVEIEASDEDGLFYAGVTLDNLRMFTDGDAVANTVIEDWPDFEYRGAMIDVARNFTTKENLLTLIDIFSHYKLNVLHLHLSDDEGWRLAVDGIDELTDVGAFHSIPMQGDESSALQPSYDGNAFPSSDALSNGYYTKEDFIEIIRYAASKHIKIIPEFDMPGHSRAAIKAMSAYEKRTGDSSMRLADPDDGSVYVSAQGYTDNVLCVALPSVYTFIDRIVGYIKEIYAKADVELLSVHLGGDEVPRGAWTASPVCIRFMKDHGMTDVSQLRSYFIRNIYRIASVRGVRLSGWEEIASNITDDTVQALQDVLYSVNCWNTVPSWGGDQVPYQLANNGYRVILSNVMNTYTDQAYSPDKREIGHSWACYLDEKKSFALQPYDIYKSVRKDDGAFYDDSKKEKLRCPENISGVQIQMFTETIRSFDDLTYDIFPKVVGVFERAWNAHPDWQSIDDFNEQYNHFYSVIVAHEMPYYDSVGINYHKPAKSAL